MRTRLETPRERLRKQALMGLGAPFVPRTSRDKRMRGVIEEPARNVVSPPDYAPMPVPDTYEPREMDGLQEPITPAKGDIGWLGPKATVSRPSTEEVGPGKVPSSGFSSGKAALGAAAGLGLSTVLAGIFGGAEGVAAVLGGATEAVDEVKIERERRRQEKKEFLSELRKQAIDLKTDNPEQVWTYLDVMSKGTGINVSHDEMEPIVENAIRSYGREKEIKAQDAQEALVARWSKEALQGIDPMIEQVPPWAKTPEFEERAKKEIARLLPIAKEARERLEEEKKRMSRQYQGEDRAAQTAELENYYKLSASLEKQRAGLVAQALQTTDEDTLRSIQGQIDQIDVTRTELNKRWIASSGLSGVVPSAPAQKPVTAGLAADQIAADEQRTTVQGGPVGLGGPQAGAPVPQPAAQPTPTQPEKPPSTKVDETLILTRTDLKQDELDKLVLKLIQTKRATDRASALQIIKKDNGLM